MLWGENLRGSGLEFLRLKHAPGSDILDCWRRSRPDREKIRWRTIGKAHSLAGSGFTGDWNGQGVDGECADGEGNEDGFGEHNDRECRKREQKTEAPGLKFGRPKRRTGVSCAAAEDIGKRTSTIL